MSYCIDYNEYLNNKYCYLDYKQRHNIQLSHKYDKNKLPYTYALLLKTIINLIELSTQSKLSNETTFTIIDEIIMKFKSDNNSVNNTYIKVIDEFVIKLKNNIQTLQQEHNIKQKHDV